MSKTISPAPLFNCDDPLAVSLFESQLANYCSRCMLPSATLKRCSSCQHLYYCSKECQKKDWRSHKLECPHMAKLEPGAFGMIMDQKQEAGYADQIMLLRLYLGYKHLNLKDRVGKVTGRKTTDLMTHVGSSHGTVKKVVMQMQIDMAKKYFPGVYNVGGVSEADEDARVTALMTEIFGAIQINATTSWRFDENGCYVAIGQILSLDISALDHSCRPNAVYVTEGRTTHVVAFEKGLDVSNLDSVRIHYVDLSMPRPLRRAALAERYFFDCNCPKCSDPSKDEMTDILCEKCGAELSLPLVPVEDEIFLTNYKCSFKTCGQNQSWDHINYARYLMVMIGQKIGMARMEALEANTDSYRKLHGKMITFQSDNQIEELQKMAESYLSPTNIFRHALTQHSILQMKGGASTEILAQFAMNHMKILQKSYETIYTEEMLFVFFRALQAMVKLKRPFESYRSILEQIGEHLNALCSNLGRSVPLCFEQCQQLLIEHNTNPKNKKKSKHKH